MSLATTLMAVGMPAELAVRTGYGDRVPLDGNGVTQAGATEILPDNTNIAMGTSAGDTAFILPADAEYFQPYFLMNSTPETALIFPPVGDTIDDEALNASVSIDLDLARIFWRVEEGRWASLSTGPGGGGSVASVVAGAGISVDATDPDNPIVSNTGVLSVTAGTNVSITGTAQNPVVNAASAPVDSVNGQTGPVVLDAANVGAVASVVAGTNITVDATDPQNPIVSAWGGGGGGTVETVAVASANGFAGTSDGNPATPTLTLSTTVAGILQGDGTAISAASTTGTGSVVLATSPTLVTPTVNAETNTGAQQLTVSPTGNATSTTASLTAQGTTVETNKREFLANLGLVSNLGNGLGTPTEDKVTLYAGIQGQSGTGAIWAGNFLTRMDAASGSYSAHGIEIDLDNLNAHRGDAGLAAPSVWGLNISGASMFRSTGAILVSGAVDQWNRGITFANDTIVQATFQDLCNADISLDIQGSHVTGLDLHSATISGYAVSLGSGHAIGWNSGDVSIVQSANQLTFAGAETAYSFESDEDAGTTTARILNNSDAATITKLTALQFSGRDTTNALKETARIEVAPPNDNWVGADMRMYVRAASGEALTEALRLGSDLSVKALSPTGGLGYGTGAGGTVTQATSKSTGVTLSKVCGQITMNNAALAANTTVSFTLTNSAIGASDLLVLNHRSAGTAGAYALNAQCAAGSASINVRNITAASLGEPIVISFAVIKSVTA